MAVAFDPSRCRQQFPALARKLGDQTCAYFDGPAGSQVPQSVVFSMVDSLFHANANRGATFATSVESDERLDAAHQALADFVGSDDPGSIVFGPNMTSLTLKLSESLAREWQAGDEVIVTDLDHDANITPWVLQAERQGVLVRRIPFRPEDCTLDLDAAAELFTERTRLVAVGLASNAVGTVNPVSRLAALARGVDARVFVDAVHSAPHRLPDVRQLDADFLVCSAYKFCGPHVGILWGKRELLEHLEPDRVRPAPNDPPGKWMTGTQNHEGIVGAAAAVEYLSSLGANWNQGRRAALKTSFAAIEAYERGLVSRLLDGLESLEPRGVRIWGIRERSRLDERVPTVSITCDRMSPREMSRRLGGRGLFAWDGNHYALRFCELSGLEPAGTLRIGLLHYNTPAEVDRLIQALDDILR